MGADLEEFRVLTSFRAKLELCKALLANSLPLCISITHKDKKQSEKALPNTGSSLCVTETYKSPLFHGASNFNTGPTPQEEAY